MACVVPDNALIWTEYVCAVRVGGVSYQPAKLAGNLATVTPDVCASATANPDVPKRFVPFRAKVAAVVVPAVPELEASSPVTEIRILLFVEYGDGVMEHVKFVST